jgi:hypothetical protein
MIYDYILSTGDSTISGCVNNGYKDVKAISSNFQNNFYYDRVLIPEEKKMQLSSNGQTFFEEVPTETAGPNTTIYQTFSGDFFLTTGATNDLDKSRIFPSSGTPLKAGDNVKYEKYTGDSAIGLGTNSANLGPALNSGISGIATDLNFEDFDYFLNGQKVYSGVGVGVSAGVGTQFVLDFDSTQGGVVTSVNKENFKAFAFIKQGRKNQITGSTPDVYGFSFIEGQTKFYLNGLDELDANYLELYTGVTIIKTGEQAIVADFGAEPTGIDLSL